MEDSSTKEVIFYVFKNKSQIYFEWNKYSRKLFISIPFPSRHGFYNNSVTFINTYSQFWIYDRPLVSRWSHSTGTNWMIYSKCVVSSLAFQVFLRHQLVFLASRVTVRIRSCI